MQPPFPLVLFDFDGTLADTLPWFTRALFSLADEFGFKKLNDAEMDRLRDSDPATILSGFGIPFWKMPRIAAALRRKMSENLSQFRLFPGIETLLRNASAAGGQFGIVSSNAEANVRTVLGPTNAACFRFYECGVAILGKASRLKRAVRTAGLKAHQALYVGDELRDLEAAEKAGLPFAAVTWGCSRAAAFAQRQPQAIFESVEQMQRHLGY